MGDALRLRNRAIHALEEANNERDEEFRRRLLDFRGGRRWFFRSRSNCRVERLRPWRRARLYRSIRPGEIQCVLVHSSERVLPEMEPGLAEYAQWLLVKRGVTLKLKARIAAASADAAVAEVLRENEKYPDFSVGFGKNGHFFSDGTHQILAMIIRQFVQTGARGDT